MKIMKQTKVYVTSIYLNGDSPEKIEKIEELRDQGFARFVATFSSALLLMIVLVAVLLVATGPVTIAEPEVATREPFTFPPPSSSVLGRFSKAAVSTDHTICAKISESILKKGGNAVEAAIASMFCLGATNPQSSGLGGGFLMTIYNKTEGRCIALDARETAPAAAHRDMFLNDSDGSKYGFRAAATPGELAGYWLAFQQYGSGNVQWKELVEPTAKLCREGVPVSSYLDKVMKVKERHFRLFPSMKAWMNEATNDTYKTGDKIPRVKLAAFLDRIANSEDPVKMFYHGEVAEQIEKEMIAGGGIMTKADLANYKVRVYDTPLTNDHFRDGYVMCGGPPPSSFAVTQLIVSVMSKLYPGNNSPADLLIDPKIYHHFVEAMKFGYAQRTLFGDHDFVEGAMDRATNLTTKEYTQWVLDRMKDTAQPSKNYGGIAESHPEDHGTSHVSVLDEQGNGVSATTTINRWFGAAVESESTGIVWNDEMDDFSTPGMANGFGFAPSKTNFIAPGKRPMSSMSPMVIYDAKTKNVRMVIGGSGGSKIISALAKSVIRPLIWGENVKQAIDSPMFHNQFTPDITQLDDAFPLELKTILADKYGQTFRNTTGFEGIIQGIEVNKGEILACGDFRRTTDQTPGGY